MTTRLSMALLALCLLTSLAFNGYLLARQRPEPLPAPAAPAPPVSARAQHSAACQTRLRRCQQEEVSQIFRVIQRAPRPAGQASEGQASGKPGRVAPAKVDLDLQQSVLCDIARRHAKQRWFHKRHRAAGSLVRSLGDANMQQQNTARDVKAFGDVLGWSEAQRQDFTRQYSPLRQQRVAVARQALQRKPPNFKAVFVQLKGLFVDEDKLMRKLHGARAVSRLRAAQLEQRTLLAAIVAAMAGMPWDGQLTW